MHHRDDSRLLLYAIVLGLALLVHLPVLIAATYFMRPSEEALPPTREVETIQLVEEEPPAEAEEQRFVSLDKPEEETPPPEDAKLLDRYNQKVEQETMRRRDPGEGAAAPPAPRARPTPPVQAPPPAQGEPAPKEAADTPEMEASPPLLQPEPEAPAARSDDGATALEVEPRRDQAPPREPGDQGRLDLDPSKILPSLENSMGGAAGSGSGGERKEYLDVEEGEKDLLNRKESRYWAFFDRVRTAVGRQWQPNNVYRAHDPRGQIYGVEDRLTILRVTLKGDGSLHNLYVEKPCGLAFLDNEAVRAMRVAQPFPNPPEGLKDEQGHISFTFGFMFEIQSQGGRIIRYSR